MKIDEKSIREAYGRMRTVDNTIPDDILDFMKEAAIEKLNRQKQIDVFFKEELTKIPDTRLQNYFH